jgi:hypothetical protein
MALNKNKTTSKLAAKHNIRLVRGHCLMILVLNNEYAVNAQTPAAELKAYLYLFNILDKMHFYACIEFTCNWVREARKGNAEMAQKLLQYRSDKGYSGEKITKLKVIMP